MGSLGQALTLGVPWFFRQQMESALEKLRSEVGSLQREEQSKLEEEKRKCLERLQQQVNIDR